MQHYRWAPPRSTPVAPHGAREEPRCDRVRTWDRVAEAGGAISAGASTSPPLSWLAPAATSSGPPGSASRPGRSAVSPRSPAAEARPAGRPAWARSARARGRGPRRGPRARRPAGRRDAGRLDRSASPYADPTACRERLLPLRLRRSEPDSGSRCPSATGSSSMVWSSLSGPGRGVEDRPVGHVVVRAPVEDLLDDGVLAVHAVVGRAEPAPSPGGPLDRDLRHPRLPASSAARAWSGTPRPPGAGRSWAPTR